MRFKFVAIAALALLPFVTIFAQEEQGAPPGGTILVEQESQVDSVGGWTLLLPNQETFQRTDRNLEVPNMIPGQFSFFTVPPKGTETRIDVYFGDDIIKSSDTPQISFELKDKMTLRVKVFYRLTTFGKVGVNSDPVGVPFELIGPNSMKRIGVTPMEISPTPIGNYSVTFKPEGCPQPSAQSLPLEKDGRADFSVTIKCETFRAVKNESKPSVVTAKIPGGTVTFVDVPSDAWFAPYVETVAKRGIMSGYTDAQGKFNGIFGPGDPVTIAQLGKIAHLAIDLDETDVVGAPKNPFARGQWFRKYLASAEEHGWRVYVDGLVDPNRPATRGEVVSTLLQILEIPMYWPKGLMFTDVKKSTPYAGEIETAAREGIVVGSTGPDGKPTGLFHPLNPITRGEMAKVLITIREKYQKEESSSSTPEQ